MQHIRRQELSLRYKGRLWWVSMHRKLLSVGREWGRIVHAVEHQEFCDMDSQKKNIRFKSIKWSRIISTDVCKMVKDVLNCPHGKKPPDRWSHLGGSPTGQHMDGSRQVWRGPCPWYLIKHHPGHHTHTTAPAHSPCRWHQSGTCSLRQIAFQMLSYFGCISQNCLTCNFRKYFLLNSRWWKKSKRKVKNNQTTIYWVLHPLEFGWKQLFILENISAENITSVTDCLLGMSLWKERNTVFTFVVPYIFLISCEGQCIGSSQDSLQRDVSRVI